MSGTIRRWETLLDEACAIILADTDNHEEDCCARGVCCYRNGKHPRVDWPGLLAHAQPDATLLDHAFDMANYRYDEPCPGTCICSALEWVEAFKVAFRAVATTETPDD